MAYRRPRVLLLGNGLNLAYNRKSVSWKRFLESVSIPDFPDTVTLPLSLEVILRTNNNVRATMKEQSHTLYGDVGTEEFREALLEVLSLGFDEIITTNYSYELETAALGLEKITDYRLKKITRSTTGQTDRKYLLHTYNEVTYNGVVNRIWHIHGEARKHESMIIDHYSYGALLNRFVNFCRWRGKERGKDEPRMLEKESWLDVFMEADVYVMGQGFDFAEMDLWWLINRKGMEKKGRVFFYEPRSDRPYDAKIALMKAYGVTPIDFDVQMIEKPGHRASESERALYREKKSILFGDFYKMAIEDMRKRLNPKRSHAKRVTKTLKGKNIWQNQSDISMQK